MDIKVLVFDFDGTLVESNQLKYEAYFDLFPRSEWHKTVLRKVLSECFEASRYVILNRILKEIGEDGDELEKKVESLANQYNAIVVEGVKTCPECHGAEKLLQRLNPHYALYLSSTTPEVALREIIRFRHWSDYFKDIFGYPRKKQETLQKIIAQENINPSQVLVVGDGESDRISAKISDCNFFCVKETPLVELQQYLNRSEAT